MTDIEPMDRIYEEAEEQSSGELIWSCDCGTMLTTEMFGVGASLCPDCWAMGDDDDKYLAEWIEAGNAEHGEYAAGWPDWGDDA